MSSNYLECSVYFKERTILLFPMMWPIIAPCVAPHAIIIYLFIKFQFNDYYKIYEIITAALAISRALGPFGKLFISMSCFLVSSISIILFPVS